MRPIVPTRDLQRRLPEAGRLRFGVKTAKAMKAIQTWRATSHDEEAIGQLAAAYGGTPQEWKGAPTPGQWEVITEASELRIVLPPDPLGSTPIYEEWSNGGCRRRCDGIECEIITQGPDGMEPQTVPCLCSAKGEMVCEPRLRLSVILPDVRFAGVWRLETKSWNAVAEIPGMVDLVASLQDRGLTRALLALEQRKQVTGGQTRRFTVPVLRVADSLDAIASGAMQVGAGSVAAIGTDTERPALGPSSSDGGEPPTSPTEDIGTGPDAPPSDPPEDDHDDIPEAEIVDDPEPAEKATQAQTRRIFAGLKSTELESKDDRREWAGHVLGREVASFSSLSKADAGKLIDSLERDTQTNQQGRNQ